ncbi:MAG: glycosyltransferase family 39 protein [Chloroflexi bacterium]|nr:glycosyltransferase family 39 protein [Chloroflexota bacterium]
MKTIASKINQSRLWLAILLLALTLPSRLINIDRAINIDEPFWIISSSNFYYSVTHRDFENTYFEYHPGVTNMWIISTALHSYFPEYRGYGKGFFDTRKPKFEEFMRSHDKEVIDLVRISRFIQAGILAVLAVTAFLLLSMLVGDSAAFFSIALATIAPFFLGHSRLLNMESMAALFVLTSFLGMQVYLNRERKLFYLLLSGATFGLAQLTKSTSIALLGVVGLMMFVGLFKRDETSFGARFKDAVKTFAIWFGTAALVYFIVWPGMWVAPGKMLSGVYGNAFSYAFQGARLDVTEELEPASFSLVTRFEGIYQYLRYWASSTTFLTWFGLAFASFFLLSKNKDRVIKSILGYLVVLGALFMLMFGIAQGRNAAHYIMSSYVAFDVIAGIGWGYALLWAQNRWRWLSHTYAAFAALIVLTVAQIGFGLPYAPYYFTYKNPFASEAATYGYGEGYAEAADYLAQKPNAEKIQAYVYNGMGTFSFFFPGKTLVFKRVYLIEEDYTSIADEIRKSDYLVLYPIVKNKQPETEKVLTALQGATPEKTIFINGLEYILIYKTTDIPESVYEQIVR